MAMGVNTEYVARMKAQLKQWDADVDALAARGEKASDDARIVYQEQMKDLRASRDAAHKTFQEMRAAGEAAGAHLKAGMEASWKAMQKTLAKVAPK
jgi:hypothetical protein